MAKFAGIFTVLFFVIAFCDALRVPIRLENDVFVDDLTTKLPETETTDPVLGDANHRPSSDVELESETHGSGSGSDVRETLPSSSEKEDSKEVTVPLTFVNFRPINRHFPKRPLAELRFHRRPCRFHHHHRFHHIRPWGPRFEIPYGQDMILSNGEEETGSDPVLGGVARQNPATWVRFQEETEENDESEMAKKIMKKMRRHRHHHHHDNGEDREKERNKDEDEDHKEYKDWFMTKVRKFLKHQF